MGRTHLEPWHVIREVARWARRHLALWIVAVTAINAASIDRVPVLISLPGQSKATIGGLLLVLLVLLVLSVAFPVAGSLVEKRDRAAELEPRAAQRCGAGRPGPARADRATTYPRIRYSAATIVRTDR